MEPLDEGHPDYPRICTGATIYHEMFVIDEDVIYFDSNTTGDRDFGVSCRGRWRARASYRGRLSNEVNWEVSWFPVHLSR
ncbi:MAG: hypothetical protein QW356_00765 [Candidatus Hadarchaeales archaeon]